MQTMTLLTEQRCWSSPAAGDADDAVDLASQVELLSKVLDEIDTGVLVCDEHAVIRTANWSAQRELAAGHLLRTSGAALCATTCDAGVRAAISAACKSGRRAVLALGAGDQRLHVSVSPLATAGKQPLALVMLGRRDPCSRVALELLGMQKGLTAAERRVLAGLSAQRSPAQIAKDHCVAISTVRSQIASLRAKLEVKSQQALVCLVYGVPPLATALRLTAAASGARQSVALEPMHIAA
jgi:DNA-binding CsgD family transcriptional regulator